tara:strand:- start:342 stop:737 length:396 start_codon:yes stop_codon:yes gene_type:complete
MSNETKPTHHVLREAQNYIEKLENDASMLSEITNTLCCKREDTVDLFRYWYENNVSVNINEVLELLDRAKDACGEALDQVDEAEQNLENAKSELEYAEMNSYCIRDTRDEIDDMIDEIKRKNKIDEESEEV